MKNKLFKIINEIKESNEKYSVLLEKYNTLYPNLFKNNSEIKYLKLNNINIDNLFCYCGNKNKFISKARGYSSHCCHDCNVKDPKTILKAKQSYIKKYGVDNPLKNEQIKNKIKQTCIEKYGVDNPHKNKDVIKKGEETCLKIYGVKNVFQNKEIKEKSKYTCKQKYGKEYYSQTKEFNIKSKKTSLKHYGVEHYTKTKEYIQKMKHTKLIKYGNENYNNYNKNKQTCLEKYGCISSSQIHIKNYENYNKEYILKHFIDNNMIDTENICKYYNISYQYACRLKDIFDISYPNKNNRYVTQKDIFNYIKSFYNGTIEFGNKKIITPYEIDIYIPDKNIAFEYDGLMYHSFGKSKYSMFNNVNQENKNIHINKTRLCKEHNIQLIHIFENEWINNMEIWKSVIQNKLGLIQNRIYARKCEIKEVNNKEKSLFLIENHLQGDCISSINIGLYYENQLVSIMTFGKPRFNKSYNYELLRFCNKIFTNIIGGASKLLSYFVKKYGKNIVSYANLRWSNGNLYEKLGFTKLRESEPNYYYFNENNIHKLYNRIHFQKHKLKDLLNNYNEKLTESENMYNNAYRKIYDCGNIVYELK